MTPPPCGHHENCPHWSGVLINQKASLAYDLMKQSEGALRERRKQEAESLRQQARAVWGK